MGKSKPEYRLIVKKIQNVRSIGTNYSNPYAVRGASLHSRHEDSRSDVLDLFAAGLSAEEILEDLPDLEIDDVRASLVYAARKLNHPVLVVRD